MNELRAHLGSGRSRSTSWVEDSAGRIPAGYVSVRET